MSKKLIRITTVPMALRYLLPGQMRYMATHGFDVLMVSADGKELPEVLSNEQCRHIIIPMTRRITPWQDLRCLWQLIRLFRKERPDIVHTHTPKAGLLGMMAARLAGVKVRIHTVAGLPLMVERGLKYQLLTLTEKITYACASQVWPNSNSLLQFIRDKRLARIQKLNIIAKGSSNGIDTSRFDPAILDLKKLKEIKDAIAYDENSIYLLCIGRLVKDKGIVELVNVFARLQTVQPSLKLVLVGDYEPLLDPLPAATLAKIEQHKAILHISWTHAVEYYMELADYFVFPSHREGFPNVLLQAGAMCLPIIASCIAGNVDIVTDRATGLIFDCGDERQLEEKIQFALEQPQQMKQMAQQLQEIVRSDYRRENIWEKLREAYERLLH